MNVMTFAHFMTKRTTERRFGRGISYRKLFAAALSDAHRLAKRYGFEELTNRMVEAKEVDQRISNEKMIVRKVVKNAIALGYTVSLYDGEEWTVRKSSNVAAVMDAVQSTDSDTLSFRKDGEKVGSVWLVYGNSASEVIADYSDVEEVQTILAPALARADKLSAVGL